MSAKHPTADIDFYSYQGQFLIATPQLTASVFEKSVIYLIEHHSEGAMGLVVNYPSLFSLKHLLSTMDTPVVEWKGIHASTHLGGPVEPERGFVLHTQAGQWESSMQLDEDLFITTSKDIVKALATNRFQGEFRFLLGYSGWGPGQLDAEIQRGDWMPLAEDPKIIFQLDDSEFWTHFMNQLHLNPADMSIQVGHA